MLEETRLFCFERVQTFTIGTGNNCCVLVACKYNEIFLFLGTKGNLTLVSHNGVNSIRAGKSSPLVPTRCLLFLVTNGNLIFLFLQGVNSIRRYASLLLVLTKCVRGDETILF